MQKSSAFRDSYKSPVCERDLVNNRHKLLIGINRLSARLRYSEQAVMSVYAIKNQYRVCSEIGRFQMAVATSKVTWQNVARQLLRTYPTINQLYGAVSLWQVIDAEKENAFWCARQQVFMSCLAAFPVHPSRASPAVTAFMGRLYGQQMDRAEAVLSQIGVYTKRFYE